MRPKKQRLKDRLWKLKSEYVRRTARGICFTCDAKNDWKLCQAGHFRHGVLDFDDDNIKCQCVRCNKWLSGNLAEYATRLLWTLGKKKFDALNARAYVAMGGERYENEWLEKEIEKYQAKLKSL